MDLGASILLQIPEDSELVRRRGRWASHKVMDLSPRSGFKRALSKLSSPREGKHTPLCASLCQHSGYGPDVSPLAHSVLSLVLLCSLLASALRFTRKLPLAEVFEMARVE